jgi:WD40 repeat protein
VLVWDVGTGAVLRECKGPTSTTTSVAFRPHGKVLAAGSTDGTIFLWAADSGKELCVIRLSPAGSDSKARHVLWLAWSPEGRHLATVNSDGTAYILRLDPGLFAP